MRKRRQFTPDFKAKVALDVLTGVQSQAEACRKHGLGPNLLALWKTAFIEYRPGRGSSSNGTESHAKAQFLIGITDRP